MIHPTAIVHPGAQVDPSTCIGPFSIIDEHVSVGPDCVLAPQVHLTGHTTIGARNRFHTGAVIGDAPQDLKYRDEPTKVVIGEGNTFREHVTVHRSNSLEEDTTIGADNFLMAHSHVGHNSHLGNRIILANGALIAGHAEIHDRVFVSGSCLVHQFVRLGTLSLMQGGSAISQDLPPFCIAWGENGVCGLNVIGLRRSDVTPADRAELKNLYHLLFRSGENLKSALEIAAKRFQSDSAREMIRFAEDSKRGICRHKSRIRE
jgi:UDP-N-acetylglucosamine acyltransferase